MRVASIEATRFLFVIRTPAETRADGLRGRFFALMMWSQSVLDSTWNGASCGSIVGTDVKQIF